jgi:two-component system, NarL family, sensor histidine kinase UhpB
VQECLTNVARHAMADRVDIDVAKCSDTRLGDAVRVVIRDNGRGFAQQEGKVTRFGLIGMRERVQALEGEFRIDSSPGGGTTVTAILPAGRLAQDAGGAQAA